MFKNLKLNINIAKYSQKTINEINKIFKECGIYQYIYERENYDEIMRKNLYEYTVIQYLLYVKNKYKRISITNLNNNENWLSDKILQLSKYKTNLEKFKFIIDGVINYIYIEHKDEFLYKRSLQIFSEYCIYYDIFDMTLYMYPNPFNFIQDYTEMFKLYFNYVNNQLEKNSLNNKYIPNIIYMYMCADNYFPLLKEKIDYRIKHDDSLKKENIPKIIKIIPITQL